jgi:hypothetical protein
MSGGVVGVLVLTAVSAAALARTSSKRTQVHVGSSASEGSGAVPSKQCSLTMGLVLSPLPPDRRPTHTADQARAVAAHLGPPTESVSVYPALVRDPIADKVGLGDTAAERVMWVIDGTVPSVGGPGGPGPFPPPGTPLREVTLVDDASLALGGNFGCDFGPHVDPAHVAPTTSPPLPGDAAAGPCLGRDAYRDATLVAAFDTTVGTLRHWHFAGQPLDRPVLEPQFLQGRPDAEPMAVCYVDGPIGAPMPPPAGSSTVPPYDRAVLLIDKSGSVWLLVATHQADTPVVRPVANGA